MKKVEHQSIFEGRPVQLQYDKQGVRCYMSVCGREAIITDKEDNVLFRLLCDEYMTLADY